MLSSRQLTCCFCSILASAVLLLQSAAAREAVPTRIASDEHVLFFPQTAALSADGSSWNVPIHGWIFEPESSDFLRSRILKGIRADLGFVVDQPSLARFDKRIRLFLVDNERDKRVGIRLCGRRFTMPESSEDGHFQRTLKIDRRIAAQHSNDGWLSFDVPLPADDRRSFRGRIRLRSATGVTVISDVDDTVKISEVTDKKRLIANTFFKEFQAADGMAKLFRTWEKMGADLTFVSASPWQLYPALSSWMEAEKFPRATFNLRQIRFRDSSLARLFDDPFASKVSRISAILKQFPQRKFILVGDSGEKDPEVYGELARRFPKQIATSLIRNVTEEPKTSRRMKKAFLDVPAPNWQVFKNPSEILLPDGILNSRTK